MLPEVRRARRARPEGKEPEVTSWPEIAPSARILTSVCCAAIDALVGVNDEEVLTFVEAVDGAYLDAVAVRALDAGLGDDVCHRLLLRGSRE